jgi:hypothetical protein
MTINDELKALSLMSSLSPSGETFVRTVCNVGYGRKVLRNNKLHYVGRHSEENVCSELGK